MRILATSALALMAATATPAFAQDATAPETFTGPRVEAIGGYDHASMPGAKGSGVVYGGAIGFDKQLGHVVIGAEGEVTGSTADDSGLHAGRDLYAGARIGFTVGDSTLIYGKGGYTNGRVTAGGTGVNFDGVRFGGGVEHDFGRFYGKVEYRYSRYQSGNIDRDQVVAGLGYRF